MTIHIRENALYVPLILPANLFPLNVEQLYQLCQENELFRFEQEANGDVLVRPLNGGTAGNRNAALSTQLAIWNRNECNGIAFGSMVGFVLPNGAMRSPIAAWVITERWNALTPEQQRKFPPLCPDFVVELMSVSDSLRETDEKLREYMDNGCRLGWLIDPRTEESRVHRADGSVSVFHGFDISLSGESVLLGFSFDLGLW